MTVNFFIHCCTQSQSIVLWQCCFTGKSPLDSACNPCHYIAGKACFRSETHRGCYLLGAPSFRFMSERLHLPLRFLSSRSQRTNYFDVASHHSRWGHVGFAIKACKWMESTYCKTLCIASKNRMTTGAVQLAAITSIPKLGKTVGNLDCSFNVTPWCHWQYFCQWT